MVVLSGLSQESFSSSTHDHYRYDVFLSFRGVDTRQSFTDHLYKTLVDANLTTFLDEEEIETGLYLKPELEGVIKASRASIIVLSHNYATSTWCLNELVLILEQCRNSDHIVIPIFYHVEPTDVRKQQSNFGDAMAKHKEMMMSETNAEKRSQWAQKMELWNKALAEIADLKGKTAKGRKETEFIEEIVTDILRRLGVPLRVALPLLIGMHHHIRFISSWLKDGSSHCVDILTILGMDGIGKTSLAKYVFGLHCREFERWSFVEDIGRRCAGQFNGLLDLQKQICADISKTSSIHVHDVSVYTSQIENALARKKVLLVLDDVDSFNQLDALLGNKGFHPGSKVVITSNDALLTEKCELFNSIVQPKHTKHLLVGLDEYESLNLLSFHAFKCNSPKEGYKEVAKTLVKYCGGHPLALEVLGKSLRNRDVVEWEDYIERLKKVPHSHIKKVFQMSLDSLEEDDKELFKHIACFFVGKDRESTKTILKGCGIHIVFGIRNLVDRCLLRIGWDNKLMMHQLLQETGRDVVRQESPEKPWKRSRLWCHEESFKVLKQEKGKSNLLGLALDMRMLEKDKLFQLNTNALSKMDNLMLLQLNYVRLNGSYKNFPQELRWLCMHGFPLEYIPPDLLLRLENLVSLDMSYSNFKSFDMSYDNLQEHENREKLSGACIRDRLLRSLKILNLSFCKQLRSLGGFIELPALERLIIANCVSLIEVCESIEQCDELVLVDLSYCNEFKNLLRTIAKLHKVKTLLLDGCDLGETSIKKRDTELSERLKANNTAIYSTTSSSVITETIPRDFRSFVISSLSSLVCLSLKDNKLSNESFPTDFSNLSMLKELYLDGNAIVSLPNCVKGLPRLEKLSIKKCDVLKTLEHPPRTLKHLIFGFRYELEKVVFHQEMSPIMLSIDTNLGSFIEGMFKVEDMANVDEEVLRSLGWTNIEFTKSQLVKTRPKVQMQYEFGIFSTVFRGKEVPNWISHRSNGSSISFTIPSSPNNLRGLNFCYIFRSVGIKGYILSPIIVSNITKIRTWWYNHSNTITSASREGGMFLSHWMFGTNEMEDGDQITISVLNPNGIRECGVSLVYDDGKMEEDVLGYYKSWNHIIGGDLSPFQTTTPGEYFLNKWHFFRSSPRYKYVENRPLFRAFSQRKSNGVGGTPRVGEAGGHSARPHHSKHINRELKSTSIFKYIFVILFILYFVYMVTMRGSP